MDTQAFTAAGGVRGIVSQMQTSAPGIGVRDSSARHGSGAGSLSRPPNIGQIPPHRQRSRDRTSPQPRTPRSVTRDLRAEARAYRERAEAVTAVRNLGPQMKSDFDAIIEGIIDRLDTLERYQRLHAQSIAFCDESITGNRTAITTLSQDVERYKEFITLTHKHIDKFVNNKHSEALAATEALHGIVAPRVDNLDHRVVVIETHLQGQEFGGRAAGHPQPGTSASHQQSQSASTRPEDFDIGTASRGPQPEPAPQEVPNYMTEDPWYQAAQQLPTQRAVPQAPNPTEGNHVRIETPEIRPRPNPDVGRPQAHTRIPQSFMGAAEPAVGSPFANGHDPFATPPVRPSGGSWPGAGAWDSEKACIFEPSRKENKLLFQFSADAKDYRLWRSRMTDHLCRSTQKWRHLLDFCAVGTQPIRKDWLVNHNV